MEESIANIPRSDMDRQRKFFGNIVLAGGVGNLPGLRELLELALEEKTKYDI